MSSRFPLIAVEVIELIASFIKPNDLRSLRLTCRELSRKTLTSYGRANFTTIQTDLSHRSLETLQNISSSDHLATHVQCLHVKADSKDFIGKDFDWPRLPSGCLADNLNGADKLREVLYQGLYNCRSIVIHTWDEYEPSHDNDRLMPSDAVGLILSIVAEADLTLRSSTVQKHDNNKARLDTPRLQVPLSRAHKYVKAWSQLEELVLDYSISSDQYDWVLHLISSVPRLRKLTLGFFERDVSFVQRLSSLHQLNRLEELRLGSGSVNVDAFTALLLRNRDTLHSLSVQFTTLDNGGEWHILFGRLNSQFARLQHLELFWLRQETNHNRVIFSKLSRYPVIPGSEVWKNTHLKYDSRRIRSTQDPIRLRYWGNKNSVVGIEYHGQGVDQVLSALADTAETD